jgi:hypothetical protein
MQSNTSALRQQRNRGIGGIRTTAMAGREFPVIPGHTVRA